MRVLVLTLMVWFLTVPGVVSQEFPKWTPERKKVVAELLAVCFKDGGSVLADLPGGKGKFLRVADRDKLRATLAAHRDRLGPEMRDALLAFWTFVNEPSQAAVVSLLELAGRETKDEHALGLAAFLSAKAARQQLRLEEAARAYKQAVSHFEKAKQLAWQAPCLNNLGLILQAQGSYGEALGHSKQALAMLRQLYPTSHYPSGHRYLATGLNNLGFMLKAQGSYGEALGRYKQALEMFRQLYPLSRYPQGHPDLATSLDNLGGVLEAQGSHTEALGYLRQALEMSRKLYPPGRYPEGHADLARSLNNLGSVLKAQGSYAEALGHYKQALEMFRRLYPPSRYPQGHPDLATSLDNLGGVLDSQGSHTEARKYYKQGLKMGRKLYPSTRYPEGHADLARSLNNLGSVLKAQGFYAEALGHYKQALEMFRQLYPPSRYPQGHPDLATSLDNLGGVLDSQGSHAEAQEYYKQALEMFRQLYPPSRYPQGHPHLAASLSGLGFVFLAQGSYGKALESYSEALENLRLTRKRIDLDGGPNAAASLRPEPQTAEGLQNRALLLTWLSNSPSSTVPPRRAERAWAVAAALHDRLRGEVLRRDADKLQHGEKADWQLSHHLDVLARLFQREGKTQDLQKAFTVIEQGRARVLLESLGQTHAATLASLPARLAAEERRLSLGLRELDARIQRLSLLPGDGPARQVRQLHADRLQLEEQEKAFLDRLRQSHPQYAGFRHPQPCSVEEARSCLRDNEVALLFAVGKNFSYALLLEKTPRPGDKGQGITLVRLPGGKDLNPLLGTLLTPETLQRPHRARDLAAELYRKLLGPLHERLKGKDLLVVPDGALALLPFEMLVEGQTDDEDGHWLIEQHRVRYAPSLSALHLSRQAIAARKDKPTQLLWALADPIFSEKDARLHDRTLSPPKDPTLLATRDGMAQLRGGTFGRLKHSGREVESICQALGVPVEKTLRGVQASEAAVKAARGELAQARFIHFATHGIVSDRSAYETALVLNQVGNDGKEELGGVNDGFLRLPEVTFLKLNADVVVLSACETARGRRSGGEGISGLARTFLYAGSKGVVCSLWSVDDSRTADLMADFYKHLKDGKSTTDALRQAQRAMLRKGLAPFFWAPFVLMGQ